MRLQTAFRIIRHRVAGDSRFAVMALERVAAVLRTGSPLLLFISIVLLPGLGHADILGGPVSYSYGVDVFPNAIWGADYAYCSRNASLSDCRVQYSSDGVGIYGGPALPDPRYDVGVSNILTVTAISSSPEGGSVASSATAEFGVLSDFTSLLYVYVSSDGAHENTACCGISYTNARVQVTIEDTVIANIPSEFDGSDVFISITVPVHLLGNGSSWGFIDVASVGPDGAEQQRLDFGYRDFYETLTYSVDEPIELNFLLRSAGDASRQVQVPLTIQSFFDSASLYQGGPGFIDSRNTIGLRVSSDPGVTFVSASGALDAYLRPTAVPLPYSGALVLMGVALLLAVGSRRRSSSGTRAR
jgi:hypothetical protein